MKNKLNKLGLVGLLAGSLIGGGCTELDYQGNVISNEYLAKYGRTPVEDTQRRLFNEREEKYRRLGAPVYNYTDLFSKEVRTQQENNMSADDRVALGFFLQLMSFSPANNLGSSALFSSGASATYASAGNQGMKEAVQVNNPNRRVIPGVVPMGRNGICVIRFSGGEDACFFINSRQNLDLNGDGVIEYSELEGFTDHISVSSPIKKYYVRGVLPSRGFPNEMSRFKTTLIRKSDGEVINSDNSDFGIFFDDSDNQKLIGEYYVIWQIPSGQIVANVPLEITK